MSLTLRPYQLAAVAKLREHPPGGKGALAVLCVGAGKTLTALTLCAEVLEAGGRVVWLAHRDELVSQPYNDMVRYWPKHGLSAGVVKAGRDAVDARMVFASVQTLARPNLDADPHKLDADPHNLPRQPHKLDDRSSRSRSDTSA